MQAHTADPDVFIRSMATRGQLGGLARATTDVALVLDAAGKSLVIIETVGVGQDEVDIVRTADCSIVILVPGTGDDVQALKAGIMEIADIFVVNKADRDGADRMVTAVESNLALQSYGEGRVAAADHQDRGHDRSRCSRTVGDDRTPSARIRRTAAHRRRRARGEFRLRELLTHRFPDPPRTAGAGAGELQDVIERIARAGDRSVLRGRGYPWTDAQVGVRGRG